MGWKKDFYAFKERVDQFIYEQQGKQAATELALREYQTVVDTLKEQNQQLHDRLMSRNLPELKTYTLPDGTMVPSYEYDMMKDEDLAGEIVEEEKEEKT